MSKSQVIVSWSMSKLKLINRKKSMNKLTYTMNETFRRYVCISILPPEEGCWNDDCQKNWNGLVERATG